MSTDTDSTTDTDAPADLDEWDELCADLDIGIAEARRKVESGRVYNPEAERVRQGWIRALAYAANTRRQIMADRDLAEYEEVVEQLEEQGLIDR